MTKEWFSYESPSMITLDKYYNEYDNLESGDTASVIVEGFKLYPLGNIIPVVFKNQTKYLVHINSVYMSHKTKSTNVTFSVITKEDQK